MDREAQQATTPAEVETTEEPVAEAQTEPMPEPVAETQAEPAAAELTAEAAPEQPAGPACPWCSAPTPPDAATCPSCHAALRSQVDEVTPVIPGVTAIDPELLAYKPAPRRPQRIVDTLIKLLDEDQDEILAGLYPEQPEDGRSSPAAGAAPAPATAPPAPATPPAPEIPAPEAPPAATETQSPAGDA
jgi:hypothetical protein